MSRIVIVTSILIYHRHKPLDLVETCVYKITTTWHLVPENIGLQTTNAIALLYIL
jgi:hypothetical protein